MSTWRGYESRRTQNGDLLGDQAEEFIGRQDNKIRVFQR